MSGFLAAPLLFLLTHYTGHLIIWKNEGLLYFITNR